MLSWVCVLLGLVALAAAQVNESLTADSSLEDRYEEAVEFRRRHFYVSSLLVLFAGMLFAGMLFAGMIIVVFAVFGCEPIHFRFPSRVGKCKPR